MITGITLVPEGLITPVVARHADRRELVERGRIERPKTWLDLSVSRMVSRFIARPRNRVLIVFARPLCTASSWHPATRWVAKSSTA